MSHLQLYKSLENNFEIGIDEAGRGPMFGRLYVAAVVLPKDGTFFHKDIKDSKKIKSVKKMKECFEYITQNSLYYAIHYIEHDVIDKINIRQAVFQGMHECIKKIYAQIETPEKIHLLVDGNDFKPYITYDDKLQYFKTLSHETVEGGDNTYMSIAAASILAKYSRDQYIIDLCEKYPDLKSKYSIHTNMGYGTQKHLEGINRHGISQWHRNTYGSCKGKSLHIVYSMDS
jgi:ribonuclease HII